MKRNFLSRNCQQFLKYQQNDIWRWKSRSTLGTCTNMWGCS